MAKGPTATAGMASEDIRDFAEQSTDRAKQAADSGVNWMREIAEQGVRQSRAVFDGVLNTAQATADIFDHQATEARQRSMTLAAETLSNTFDFAQRFIRAGNPQEMIQLQSEFITRQVQMFAEQTKELGQNVLQGANEAARTSVRVASESFRR